MNNLELSTNTLTHVMLIKQIVPLWYAQVEWAKFLIKAVFNLEDAEHILIAGNRGRRQIPGTVWFIRTHGVGVDIYKAPGVGGVDFDFNKPHPDFWRLKVFFEKQINDGILPYAQYQDLIENEELLDKTIRLVLNV